MLLNLLPFLTPVSCDSPYPWQLGFQDGSTPIFEGIVELHDTIFFYLVVISFLVFWMMSVIVVKFSSNKVGIVHKYHNHGTLIELIWTITPALILIAIAFPSFKLLYLMDFPLGDLDLSMYAVNSPVSLPVLKKIPVKSFKSDCISLVVRGAKNTLGSTTGINLNNYVRNITPFSQAIISQFVGHLLGDGSLIKSRSSITPYFVMTQTIKRFEYIWSIFMTLTPYVIRYPSVGLSRGKYLFVQASTRSYPYLSTLFELFYSLHNGKWVKVISSNLILYLDDIALAYWAMDDGASTVSGFYLHTKSFTFIEVYKLAGMLHYLFGLNSNVQNHKGQPVIYITARSYSKFVSIVKPHFHSQMLYKLNRKSP
jgi:LAGLIDADG DNA endonuclease family/Cytochrome C oxidase subunit II, transmembrane domain